MTENENMLHNFKYNSLDYFSQISPFMTIYLFIPILNCTFKATVLQFNPFSVVFTAADVKYKPPPDWPSALHRVVESITDKLASVSAAKLHISTNPLLLSAPQLCN